MKKDNTTRTLAVAAIMLALVGLTIGFAAFSTSLTINGQASIQGSSWKIKFANLSSATLTGTAQETTAPTINTNDTNIGTYAANFKTPGDSISYIFDVVNDGSFNAKISTLTFATPSCTGTGANATVDAANVCDHIVQSLVYTSDSSTVAVGDTLTNGQTRQMKLTLTYSDAITADKLPNDDVSVVLSNTTITYSQD